MTQQNDYDSIMTSFAELGTASADHGPTPSSTTHGPRLSSARQSPNPNRPGGPWTEELVERLKTLHEDTTLSFSHIARRLGHGLTRNAVIGKAARLGLPRRAPEQPAARLPKAPRYKPPRRQAPPRHCRRRKARDTSQQFAASPASCPAPLLIPLIETTACQCKFIPGHDGLCCAHPVVLGGSWCGFHRRIVEAH